MCGNLIQMRQGTKIDRLVVRVVGLMSGYPLVGIDVHCSSITTSAGILIIKTGGDVVSELKS